MSKADTVSQVKGKVEQLSDAAMKERLRPLAGRAIERLKELMESKNEAIAMGAAKMVINKFIPDLKVTELQGNEDKPLGVVVLPPLDKDEPSLSMASTSGAANTSTPEAGV